MPSEWVIGVSQLNEYVRRQLAGDPMLRDLRVRGEISGFKRHYTGHLYFSLKDAQARVNCVMFRQSAMSLDFEPRDGMQVVARGSASLFTRDGSYQVYCEGLRREGAGDLYARFEQLKQALLAEGLFDPSVKKQPPLLPRRVGIVTSIGGAALRDMVRVINRRFPGMPVLVSPCAVQGAEAPSQIACALDALSRDGSCDVILCGRGGGSIEDLWAFNEEEVARAIFRCRIPVISCVGHETDTTIADFVADARAATPSMAAEMAVPVLAEMRGNVNAMRRRMARAEEGRIKLCRARLNAARLSPVLTQTKKMLLAEKRAALDRLAARAQSAGIARADAARKRLLRAQGMLRGLNPAAVLERGYAVVERAERLVTDASALNINDEIRVRMHNGAVRARVTGTEDNHAV